MKNQTSDRVPRYLTSHEPAEEYANAFAMALLMPADIVLALDKGGLTADEMAIRFGVPTDVMVLRLDRLKSDLATRGGS